MQDASTSVRLSCVGFYDLSVRGTERREMVDAYGGGRKGIKKRSTVQYVNKEANNKNKGPLIGMILYAMI